MIAWIENQARVEVLDTDQLLVVIAPGGGAPGEHDWLMTHTGCVHREIFDRHVAPHITGLNVEAEAPTPDALLQLARQGAGRALLPALAVAEDLADGALIVDSSAPDVGGTIEIIAVPPRRGPSVHRFLRRAVDHSLTAGTGINCQRSSSGAPERCGSRLRRLRHLRASVS